MAEKALVDNDVRLGQEVVNALDSAHVPYRAALWYDSPEFESWRLLIATRLVRTSGPLKAYERIRRVLAKHAGTASLSPGQLWLVDEDFPLIDNLAKTLHLRRGVEVRFAKHQVQDFHIKDAHIYRLES